MSDTPQNSGISNEPRLSLIDFYTRIIFFIALQLVLCHFFLPDYTWGQGRGSYFILTNRLSLGSWFTSILLLITSGFCLTLYLKNTQNKIWISGAVLLLLLSFFEFSRFGDKSGWIQLDVVRKDGSIEWMYFFRLSYIAIISTPLLAYFISRIRTSVKLNSATKTALTGWGITWALSIAFNILALGQLLGFSDLTIGLARGSTHLMGTVFLFYLLGSLLDPECELIAPVPDVGDLEPPSRTAQLIMVGGAAFIVIFLEIILFRIFLIHGNYVPANYALSIDLPGLATGVLAGHYVVKNRRTDIASTAAILLPASIIFSLGPASYAGDWPVVSALFLTFPFACASLFITIGLSYSPSNLIYGIELLGAGLAVFAVNPTLVQVREEGSFLVLGALAALVGACWFFSIRKLRKRSLSLGISMLLFVIGFLLLAQLNQNTDTVNIVREKILLKYPDGRVFFSKSTLVGRVDIGQSNREKHSIKNYENGRVIDTLRPYPRENYTIDPRLPHNMIDSPSVFIIGLAGEGITKTATNIGREVIGVEINPATVELMTENIAPYAHNIYDGIDVEILDGRTYLMRSDKKFDYITVLNTHFARGSTPGRAASAEYLHTVEAFSLYLDHLTDSGFIDIEEPANRLHHEAPIWKTLVTLRETLLRNGITNPEKHFLLFQWVTKTNRYIQIFVKRTPVTPLDLEKFNVWMSQIDQLGDIEKKEGRRMGPLHGARTEVLYSPDREYSNNYAHAINGTLTPTLIKKFVLNPSTDDRPFTYFVNPSAPGLRSAYSSVLILSLPLLLMIFLQLKKEKADSLLVNNYAAAAALSGFGYLFIELALIQKFQLLLGSPVVALAVVLGGMLIFSGVGSLLSNRVGLRGVAVTVGAISLYIPTLYASLPYLLTHFATADFTTRVAVSTFSIAPLAMLMGIPLAYLIRESRDHVGTTSGALMYAINSVAGALAVPLTLNLSTSYGFIGTALFASASYFGMVLLFATLQSPHLKKPGLMLALGLIGILITIPWHRSIAAADQNQEGFDVFAVRYGRSRFRDDKIFIDGNNSTRRFNWYFWIVRDKDRLILVDTGFDDDQRRKQFKIEKYRNPLDQLHEFGVRPEEVTDVILTHLHWDHAGNVDKYPNARIWVQKDEYEFANTTLKNARSSAYGMKLSDLETLMKAEVNGRLHLIDGDTEMAGGIRIVAGNDHTVGSQYVVVPATNGNIVLAGDASYLYRNHLHKRPLGTSVSKDNNLKNFQDMQHIAACPLLVIPGHDHRVAKRFPEVARDIYEITLESR